MRFVRFDTGAGPQWGIERDDLIHVLDGVLDESLPLSEVSSSGYLRTIEAKLDRGDVETVAPERVRRLAPVPRPGKLVCVGLNYHDHAEEQDEDVPETPMLFSKASSSVIGPESPIVHPSDVDQVDYEVELAFVIGTTAKDVAASDAKDYLAGYTVLNDVSARDAQFADGQFFRGKSYDTFAPMGPALVTPDAVNPNALDVELRVNGDVKQSSSTREFIFDVGELVEYISSVMTLRPGDVVSTGTPGGVGIFRDPPDLLSPGDVVETEIDGIGCLRNEVVSE